MSVIIMQFIIILHCTLSYNHNAMLLEPPSDISYSKIGGMIYPMCRHYVFCQPFLLATLILANLAVVVLLLKFNDSFNLGVNVIYFINS